VSGEKGQAVIEYILLVVVSVILVVGVTVAFFKPLQNFVAQLNDTYIKCLLETGELPKVGTQSTGLCDDEMPKFQGKNFDGTLANTSDGSGKNGDGSQNAENKASSTGGGDSGDGSGGKSRNAGQLDSGYNRKSSLIRNGMQANGSARGDMSSNGKTTEIPVDEFNAGEGFMNVQGGNGYISVARQKKKRIDLSGLMEYDRKQAEREAEKVRTIAMESESFTQTKNKKITVKPPPEKTVDANTDVDTDYSSYFKIFFIIIIILFIIILMGGQALQMTNNSD
jgi:hypothetical protein